MPGGFPMLIIFAVSVFTACVRYETVEAPAEIRLRALEEAVHYIGMEYEYGGQDSYEKGIDCSGLVVNCYAGAVRDTGYRLPFSDAATKDFLEYYTISISDPSPGDLIFMGDDEITHVALFSCRIGSDIFFVDASSVSGVVDERHYPADNPKIKAFGRLLLEQKRGL